MALGTTNIGLAGVQTEFGKTTRPGGLNLRDYVNAGIETTSSLGYSNTEKGMDGFKSYDHSGCVFKFDPFQPTVISKTVVDLYDDTVSFLPSQSQASIYTENFNANSEYVAPSGGSPGYLKISGTTTNRSIRWSAVSDTVSYKRNQATYAFWVYFDTLPSSGLHTVLQTNADDSGAYNYYGVNIVVGSDGEIRILLGSGVSRASTGRYTYGGSASDVSTGSWHFICLFVDDLLATATITPIASSTLSTTNTLSYLSGTGNALVHENTLHLTMGGDSYLSNPYNGRIGHVYVFDSAFESNGAGSVLEDIYTTTKTFY